MNKYTEYCIELELHGELYTVSGPSLDVAQSEWYAYFPEATFVRSYIR